MKKSILCISFLLICLFVLYRITAQNVQVMGADVVSRQEIERLQAERNPLGKDHVKLKINGIDAAYEEEEARYYIPENIESSRWTGSVGASADEASASVVWAEDDAFKNMGQAVREEHVFCCLIYNDTGYEQADVLFTGLPVMQIDGEMGAAGTRVRVFDPVKSLRGDYQAEDCNAYYNIRGNASKRFEKIGYRLEFFHEDGSPGKDLSLLGMRSDNDWQLKAMYSDRSKLRDKLSIDLWNQIAAQTESRADDGCHMEYLELIVNGEYRGLYGLVEPTDYKSLNLDKTKDLIYKTRIDILPNDKLFEQSEAEQSFSCGGISIRQSDKAFYPGIWEPFRTFWDHGYEMGSKEDLEVLYSCIDRQNFIAYNLYYNAISGVDNRFKNIIYSTVVHANGTYTIRRIPWDQNYSWGDDYEEGEYKDDKNIRYNPGLYERWLEEEVFQNMQKYDAKLAADMKSIWNRWRKSFLKEEDWKTYARELMDALVDSGAFARDTRRWPDSGNIPDSKEIEAFIDARFVWLDAYLERM